jgi:hypothetical protein
LILSSRAAVKWNMAMAVTIVKKAQKCHDGTKFIPASKDWTKMKDTVSHCPVENAMLVLAGRWRILLIYYLLEGTKRFSDLRRDMPKISQRMLTLDLRALEAGSPQRGCVCARWSMSLANAVSA